MRLKSPWLFKTSYKVAYIHSWDTELMNPGKFKCMLNIFALSVADASLPLPVSVCVARGWADFFVHPSHRQALLCLPLTPESISFSASLTGRRLFICLCPKQNPHCLPLSSRCTSLSTSLIGNYHLLFACLSGILLYLPVCLPTRQTTFYASVTSRHLHTRQSHSDTSLSAFLTGTYLSVCLSYQNTFVFPILSKTCTLSSAYFTGRHLFFCIFQSSTHLSACFFYKHLRVFSYGDKNPF